MREHVLRRFEEPGGAGRGRARGLPAGGQLPAAGGPARAGAHRPGVSPQGRRAGTGRGVPPRFPELKSDPAAELELITAERELRRRSRAGPGNRRIPGPLPPVSPGACGPPGGGSAPSSATLAASWNCPQCHEPLEVPAGTRPEQAVVCPSCGMTIRLDPGPLSHLGPRTVPARQVRAARRGRPRVLRDRVPRPRHRTGSAVALKILRAGPFATPEEVDRFLREWRSAAQLKHPQIVAVHDAGRIDETCYLAWRVRAGHYSGRGDGRWPTSIPRCRRAGGRKWPKPWTTPTSSA